MRAVHEAHGRDMHAKEAMERVVAAVVGEEGRVEQAGGRKGVNASREGKKRSEKGNKVKGVTCACM